MIEIRRAQESDAFAIAELGKATFSETFANENSEQDILLHVASTYSEEKQLQEIRDLNRWIEIAWSGNIAIGFLHCSWEAHLSFRHR